jgi:hypothetical protein
VQLAELSAHDWVKLSELVAHIWIFALAMIISALSYMVAHAMLPSLAYTGDLPSNIALRMRMPLYTVMAIGITTVIVVAIKAILLALNILPVIYPRLAI